MKNHHFLKFFWWVGTHKAKMSKIEHFWWCFKTCSSHHKLSSKVCKIVLRACRNVFWWKITFWNTSGHIIGHHVTSSKSSSKSWFFSKIQNSQKMIKTQLRFWWFLRGDFCKNQRKIGFHGGGKTGANVLHLQGPP